MIAADSDNAERCKVIVLVQDENDNEPDVFVTFTHPHSSIPNAGKSYKVFFY